MSTAGVALDIGGTKILSAPSSSPDDATRLDSRTGDGGEVLLAQVVAAVEQWRPGSGSRVVVASAGRLDHGGGVVVEAANLPWRDFPLASRLGAATDSEVELIGDAGAAAVAELGHEPRRHHRTSVFVTVSTGIGMGVVREGRLDWDDGHDDKELGHRTVDNGADALLCGCGRRGCLEAYSSGRALLGRYDDLARQEGDGAASRTPLRVSDLVRREADDPVAAFVVDDALARLTVALVDVFAETGASLLVLGGGVMLDADLYPRLRRRLLGHERSPASVEATVFGGLAAVHGAAAICERDDVAMRMVDGGGGWS